MFHGHSVLGSSTGIEHGALANAITYAGAALAGGLLQASSIAVYAVALFVTARMVWERVSLFRSGEKLRIGEAIVALSIRGLLVSLPLGIAGAVIISAVMRSRWHALATWWVFTQVLSAVTMCAFAYVMTPPAMRLLADPTEEPTKQSFQLGRKCAVAAVLASAGLMILDHIVIGPIDGNHAEILVIRAIASPIAALPYAPLYIALSLLARVEQAELPSAHIALGTEGI